MDRRIQWSSGCYEAMNSVYERAGEDPRMSELLSALEERTLRELGEQCAIGRVKKDGQRLSRDWPLTAEDKDKETLLYALGNAGLRSYRQEVFPPSIEIVCTPLFPQLVGCSTFLLLNKLECLDGAMLILLDDGDKNTLHLSVPAGELPGLEETLELLGRLFPWLSVVVEENGEKGAAPIARQS